MTALTSSQVHTVAGIDFPVTVHYALGKREILITEIRVKLGGQLLNGVLCEDVQKELEAAVLTEMQEDHGPIPVMVGKHLDEVLA